MTTTKLKFSPSINIIRDSNYAFDYIPTHNSLKVFDQILNDAISGVKCNLIIGAYGTGKSSFLLAFQQTLQCTYNHFANRETLQKAIPKYEFVQLVGDNKSLFQVFAEIYEVDKDDYTTIDVINAVDKKYKQLQKQGLGLALVIDEFGKYLEYASKNNPEVELYFIQQLCEWVNNTITVAILIGTLHQDFNAYSLNLTKNQQQEWSKVKGRFKEVPFNEPVEQLLFLASKRIAAKFIDAKRPKQADKLFSTIKSAKAFPLKDYLNKDVANALYPFDILSAAVLTLSLQRYGQNERSLFSFIESNDNLSLSRLDLNHSNFFSVDKVYDYLISNFYSVINNKAGKNDSTPWNTIRKALEKTEGVLPSEIQSEAQALLKTIGLLNIFTPASAKLDREFYENYCQLAIGIKHPSAVLEQLEKFKIVKFAKHSFRYVFLEGTDLDIDLAIDEAGSIIERTTNIGETLRQYFDIPPIAAKSVFYEKGTPRFFQFTLSESPIVLTPEGQIDGFINLIFNEDQNITESIKHCSVQCSEAVLFGYYKNTINIRNILFEIQKAKAVKSSNLNDRFAVKELDGIISHYIRILNHYVIDSLYSNNNIEWYYHGAKISLPNQQAFNQKLSSICQDTYPGTPTLKNELLNKTRTSGQIATARKELIKRLFKNLTEENVGFPNDKFPPEKTIYLSLLKEKGLHMKVGEVWGWNEPSDSSFKALWARSVQFLESSKGKEKNLQEFIDFLLNKPFKLKQGLIDFWIPIFLLSKADEYALFDNNGYIPTLNEDILELINKKPELFKIKAFDVDGIKLELFNRYRTFLSQIENIKPNNKVFIQTIKPFLVFYRDLSEYAKKTKNISKKALSVRNVIANAKDPEKAFFEDFPTALGYTVQELQTKPGLSETFIKNLQEAIREIRTCFDGLLNRFETYITNEILGTKETFPDYKTYLIDRYKGLKLHLLSNQHKSFYSRVISPLEDRTAWLNSIAQSCVGKALHSFADEDEVVLIEKFADYVYTLDNLSELSEASVNEEEEEVFKFDLTSFGEGHNTSLLRIPKAKTKKIEEKKNQIKHILGNDKKINIAVLAHLIKEYLKNE